MQLFLKKLSINKIFSTQFKIKKVMSIFDTIRLRDLKNGQMCPQNSLSQFSQKILLLFSKKLWNKKNIQHLIYNRKVYIHYMVKLKSRILKFHVALDTFRLCKWETQIVRHTHPAKNQVTSRRLQL